MISYKPILAYFNKLHGEAYKKNLKKLIGSVKIDHLNDNTVIFIKYVKVLKNRKENFKILCKKR